ncbi:MAG: anti-sigma factor family protein [Gaiellaceae bacterium]
MLNLLLRPWTASCHETRDRLSDYVEDELTPRERTRITRHLSRCERCRALLESLTRILDELRSLRGVEQAVPARTTVSSVLARIQPEER